MDKYVIKKVLNNNVVIADHEEYGEVVLTGKGVGFQRKKCEVLINHDIEKIFVLKDKEKQEQYKKLLPQMDEKTLDAIVSALELIREQTEIPLSEHMQIALSDHILFSVQRYLKGLQIKNPFLIETKTLYPKEYEIAKQVVNVINEEVNIRLPEDEIGFITLHIHSALSEKDLSLVSSHSQLVGKLIQVVENELNIEIDKTSIDYFRLVRHLRYTIERVISGQRVEESPKISFLLQREYPLCYNLSWKLIKIMQNTLKKPIEHAEAIYLTMHLQRIYNKN